MPIQCACSSHVLVGVERERGMDKYNVPLHKMQRIEYHANTMCLFITCACLGCRQREGELHQEGGTTVIVREDDHLRGLFAKMDSIERDYMVHRGIRREMLSM